MGRQYSMGAMSGKMVQYGSNEWEDGTVWEQ